MSCMSCDAVRVMHVCSGSVVVTAYDFESTRPGSNPEWGPTYYEASITAQGSPEPSSLRGSTLGSLEPPDSKSPPWSLEHKLYSTARFQTYKLKYMQRYMNFITNQR